MIKYVFFDLGLTLAENFMPQSYRQAMTAAGLEVSAQQAEQIYHLANKYFMRERPGELGKGNRKCFEDYVAYACMLAGDERKAPEVIDYLVSQKKTAWTVFPYTLSVLQELKDQGVKTGLISNWDSSCRTVLKENGLDEFLDVVVISSEEGVEKPDARMFEKALALAGILPDECIYVGDNYYDDAVGAAKLGIRSFILNPPDYLGIEELREKEVPVVTDIREIPRKIRELS